MFPNAEEARIVVLLRRIAAAAIILAALTGLAAIAFAGTDATLGAIVTSSRIESSLR
jgi:NAD/NADP transhydrogenase alpha subunit